MSWKGIISYNYMKNERFSTAASFKDYLPHNVLYRQAVEEAYLKSLEILSTPDGEFSPEGRTAIDIINSYKRVSRIRNTVYLNPEMSAKDLQYDLQNFEHKNMTCQDIESGIRTLYQLMYCYNPVSDAAVVVTTYEDKPYDNSETQFVAKELLERTLLMYWEPEGVNPEEVATHLSLYSRGSLRNIINHELFRAGNIDVNSFVHKPLEEDFIKEDHNILQSDDSTPDPLVRLLYKETLQDIVSILDTMPQREKEIIFSFMQGKTEEELKGLGFDGNSIRHARLILLKNLRETDSEIGVIDLGQEDKSQRVLLSEALGSIYKATKGLSLKEIISLTTHLYPQEQKDVLKVFGYYKPDISLFEYYNQSSRERFVRSLQIAAAKISVFAKSGMNGHNEDLDIQALVAKLEDNKVIRTIYQIINPSSTRYSLITMGEVEKKILLGLLPDREKLLLSILTEEMENGNYYSNKEIGEKLGLTDHKVAQAIELIGRIYNINVRY